MDNSPRLPTASLVLAIGLAIIATISFVSRAVGEVPFLSEVELGLVAAGFALAIFGIQGLISILVEGRRLHPGIVRPRLTDPLSVAIAVSSLVLFGIAVALAYGVVLNWSPIVLGVLAGAGSLILAMLLVFYKEAFVGDEACLDDRDDGVPW